jgi:uncharacterized protein YcgI (DUF1989 family)
MAQTTLRTVVPARRGRAVRVARGEFVRVSDVEGQQVGDLFAFAADDPLTEYLSASHTRAEISRTFPTRGEAFVTNRRRPILTVVADTSPGHHDLLIAACDADRYVGLGVADHPSCAENLTDALTSLGLSSPVVPQPVNVFMRVPVAADGRLESLPAATKPDDAITFRAELDWWSSCPLAPRT